MGDGVSHKKGIEAAQDKIYDVVSVDYGGLSRDSDAALQIIKAYLNASGMVMVPRDATDDMVNEAGYATMATKADIRTAYEVMVHVVPNPFQTPEERRE